MHAKYIVAQINGQEVPIVFPDHPCPITHRHIAQAFPSHIVAAGYCCLETWGAFGEGISVDKKSRGGADTKLLLKYFSGA